MDHTPKLLKVSHIENGIVSITLSRVDALNALNAELLHELNQVLTQVKNDKTVRAILITGDGAKAFCAGADINQLAHLDPQAALVFARQGQMIFRTLEQLGKPSLAAINGYALGGGCELAMATTLRIAASTAIFGQPEIKLGVIPGFGGTQRLSRLIGKGRALDVCLSGRTISATDALHWGLVNEVVEPSALMTRATEILNQLTKLAPIALQSIMTVIDQGYDLSLNDALEFEAAHFALCCATNDKKEGVAAFLEKRPATFSGA